MSSSDEIKEEIQEEPEEIITKVEITNPPQEKDQTSWETKDEWDIIEMTEQDIAEAEESRNA